MNESYVMTEIGEYETWNRRPLQEKGSLQIIHDSRSSLVDFALQLTPQIFS